jgi:hypothetical protein
LAPEEYVKQKHQNKALTVQELMYERQFNASMAGQNEVFTVADNAIGIDKITDNLSQMIKAFGLETNNETKTYSKDQAKEMMVAMGGKAPTAQEAHAMSILNDMINSPSEYSKVDITNSSARNNIDKAIRYM